MIRWHIAAVFGPLAILACVAAPVTLAVREQRQVKNFHVVREGVLYRSAQLTPAGLRRVVHDQRIRTVVNLREGTAAVDLTEEEYCRRQEIRFIRLLPKSWDDSAGKAEVDDNVRVFLDVMRDPANYPVLVHCFAGIHRTGAYCAVYRMEFEGWDNAKAIAEVKAMGYDNFDNEMDIRGWLEGYRAGRLSTWPNRPESSGLTKLNQTQSDPKNVRTDRGYLTQAHSQPIDGRRPYLLQLAPAVPGMSWLYVVAGPGVNLEALAGRDVTLRGPITYEPERRAFVIQGIEATE
jgi:tyrosine-protein phosphatase SIW14